LSAQFVEIGMKRREGGVACERVSILA